MNELPPYEFKNKNRQKINEESFLTGWLNSEDIRGGVTTEDRETSPNQKVEIETRGRKQNRRFKVQMACLVRHSGIPFSGSRKGGRIFDSEIVHRKEQEGGSGFTDERRPRLESTIAERVSDAKDESAHSHPISTNKWYIVRARVVI